MGPLPNNLVIIAVSKLEQFQSYHFNGIKECTSSRSKMLGAGDKNTNMRHEWTPVEICNVKKKLSLGLILL